MKNKPKNQEQKLGFSTALLKGGFIHNPVLTRIIGVCPIVAAATTFKNAAVLSLVLSVSLIFCEMIASLALKKIERNVRVCLYCLIASIPTILSTAVVSDKTLSSLGIFLPLLSVNAIIVVRCEKFAVKTTVKNSFFDAVATAAGFSAVALIVGFIRELFSFGTVFSLKLFSLPRFSAFALPFGGLLVLGFLAAAHKAIVTKRFENETADAFNFSKVFEKAVFRDPGLGIFKNKDAEPSGISVPERSEIRARYSSEETDEKKEDKT